MGVRYLVLERVVCRMSIQVLTEAWATSEANATTLLVLLALADNADREGHVFCGEACLAISARCDVKTVRTSIRWLQEHNELDVWEMYERKTGRRRNTYRVVVGVYQAFKGVPPPPELTKRASVLRVNLPTATRRAVFERDGWTCVACDSKDKLTIDHKVPVAEGGGNELENLQTLCSTCNSMKSSSFAGDSRPGETPAWQPGEAPAPDRADEPLQELKLPLQVQDLEEQDLQGQDLSSVEDTNVSSPSAQQILSDFIDEFGRPPERTVGMLARNIKALLTEGTAPTAIVAGLRRMAERRIMQPALLCNFIAEAQLPSGAASGRNGKHGGYKGQSAIDFVRRTALE